MQSQTKETGEKREQEAFLLFLHGKGILMYIHLAREEIDLNQFKRDNTLNSTSRTCGSDLWVGNSTTGHCTSKTPSHHPLGH